MRLRDRAIGRIATAPLKPRHWAALGRMLTTYEQPAAALRRYVSNGGVYPWYPTIRTPSGVVRLVLNDYHDLLTVNEVFCRRDYGSGKKTKVVVDIGANVGLAALFFLTRNTDCRVYCFEPDPANSELLRRTLSGFEQRYALVEAAVTAHAVRVVQFVPRGRYGHVATDNEDAVEVPAIEVVRALQDVLVDESRIDLVKIDTEGTEWSLVEALATDPVMARVAWIVYEDNEGRTRWLRTNRSAAAT